MTWSEEAEMLPRGCSFIAFVDIRFPKQRVSKVEFGFKRFETTESPRRQVGLSTILRSQRGSFSL